jgi:hypothetical protein
MAKKPLLYATRIGGITRATLFYNGKKIRFIEWNRAEETRLEVTYEDDITRVALFEQGNMVVCLEEKVIAGLVIDIAVSAADCRGRLLCNCADGEVNMVGSENLPLVLKWVRRWQKFLRLPL